jgi:hypothetical protein
VDVACLGVPGLVTCSGIVLVDEQNPEGALAWLDKYQSL